MIGLLLAMYPARWRSRYGEEFRAVLESRPLGPFDFADVLIGALDARLTPNRLPGSAGIGGGPLVMLRLGGFGAIAGGVLWFVSMVAVNLFEGERIWVVLAAVGTFGLLLALIGLTAFQAHRDPVLVWFAFAIPALGALASTVGLAAMALGAGDDPMVGTLSAWSLWAAGLLATVVGSVFFAIATIRAKVFSRRASQALAISSVVVLIIASGLQGGVAGTAVAQLVIALSLGSFASSWITLGIAAIRRGPIRAIAPA
jgi:hypothetical protein